MNRNNLYLLAMLCGLGLCFAAFTGPKKHAYAQGKKANLKVLPKNTSKKELKTIMKGVSKALGVQCDHCHDMGDMSSDTPMKTKARSMFRMTNTINQKMKKDGFANKVSCKTCHNGNAKPSN